MKQHIWHVLGLMSGTSLDGIDLAYCRFSLNNQKWDFEIKEASTHPYPSEWRQKLTYNAQKSAEELLVLDHDFEKYLAAAVTGFMHLHELEDELDLIASHGHTYYHRPEKGYTFQLGNGPGIYAMTGITTICDFRRQDIALGGQGAPLVPVGDALLFGNYNSCLNIGGFANISFQKDHDRIAFDICPVNFVLNFLSGKLGKEFDENGAMAASGKLNAELLNKLNNTIFFNQNSPRSLGAEWVEEHIFPLLENSKLEISDLLHTFVLHAAQQICKVIDHSESQSVLVTGGGAYNSFFIETIQKNCSAKLIIPEPRIIEFKEALTFAFLGLLRSLNQVNIYASVTGASRNHSSGILYGPAF